MLKFKTILHSLLFSILFLAISCSDNIEPPSAIDDQVELTTRSGNCDPTNFMDLLDEGYLSFHECGFCIELVLTSNATTGTVCSDLSLNGIVINTRTDNYSGNLVTFCYDNLETGNYSLSHTILDNSGGCESATGPQNFEVKCPVCDYFLCLDCATCGQPFISSVVVDGLILPLPNYPYCMATPIYCPNGWQIPLLVSDINNYLQSIGDPGIASFDPQACRAGALIITGTLLEFQSLNGSIGGGTTFNCIFDEDCS